MGHLHEELKQFYGSHLNRVALNIAAEFQEEHVFKGPMSL
jgi:hypothetical protein